MRSKRRPMSNHNLEVMIEWRTITNMYRWKYCTISLDGISSGKAKTADKRLASNFRQGAQGSLSFFVGKKSPGKPG